MKVEANQVVSAREILWVTREFQDSVGYGSTDQIEKSATDYFGTQYLDHLKITANYRRRHKQLLEPLTFGEAQESAEMYEAMFEKVIDARIFLDQHAPVLLEMWLASADASLSMSYTDVLSDILEHSPDFIAKYLKDDPEQYHADCFNTIQWLDGWLRSELSSD